MNRWIELRHWRATVNCSSERFSMNVCLLNNQAEEGEEEDDDEQRSFPLFTRRKSRNEAVWQ